MDISLAGLYSNLRPRCFILRVFCTYKATLPSLFLDGYIGAIVSLRVLERERENEHVHVEAKSQHQLSFIRFFLTAYYTMYLWRSFLPPRRFQGLNSKLSGLTAVPLPCWSDCSFIVYVCYVLRDQRTICKSYTKWVPGIELKSYRQEP